MARSLFLSLSKTANRLSFRPSSSSSRLLSLRTQSNQPDHSDSSTSSTSTDPLISKLEEAIYRIIVRRSAPDWLPFLPGSSYWVPPPTSQFYGVAQLVEKLSNPLTPEQSMSTNSARGWPSSDYFIKGAPLPSMEVEKSSTNASKSEDLKTRKDE